MSEPILCFISHDSCPKTAYFTTLPLESQRGDDWNDAPYEHNAGSPYPHNVNHSDPQYDIIHVYYSSEMKTPGEKASHNSAYSVQDINARVVAWLVIYPEDEQWSDNKGKFEPIYAGCTISEFKRIIKKSGGTIWIDEV